MISENKLLSSLKKSIRERYYPEEKTKENKDGTENVFFRKGGKSLCYIEIDRSNATVVIVFGKTIKDNVKGLDISPETIKIYESVKEFHDGKWLFIKLDSEERIEDIMKLLSVKRKPE